MNDDLYGTAKDAIFGVPPTCRKSMIGYDIAMRYYAPLLAEAESALLGTRRPSDCLLTYLLNGFSFSAYRGFGKFPQETQAMITSCAERFTARYRPLCDWLSSQGLDHHQR